MDFGSKFVLELGFGAASVSDRWVAESGLVKLSIGFFCKISVFLSRNFLEDEDVSAVF